MKPIKDDKEKLNVHKGHRARLRETYKINGINGLHPHEALELLLFFGIPYKDTNETAHDLINHFGSMEAVFAADIENLKSIKNMTENAAVLIKLFADMSKVYLSGEFPQNEVYDTKEKLADYVSNKFIGEIEERVILVLLDASDHIIDCICIGQGSASVSEVNIGRIVKIANSRNSPKLVIAHNHPDNGNISTNDIISSRKISHSLNSVDIKLVECFVVTKNEVLSTLDRMPVSKRRGRPKKGD